MTRKPIIELKDVTFTYFGANQPVLRDVSLQVCEGEFLCIMGPTGAGKTTLLYVMSGVIPHFFKGKLSGEVLLRGRSIRELTWGDIIQDIGLVLEDPETQLFNLFVRDELVWALENRGLPREDIVARSDHVAHFFEIDHLIDRVTFDVSGGEKQKIALASIYALQTDILLLDEPTSQLDPAGTELVFDAIRKIATRGGKTIVMVEHKSEEIARFADRVVLLDNGQILCDSETKEFFGNDELLSRVGIDVPQVSELTCFLRKEGVSLEDLPVTIDQALPIYGKLLSGRNEKRSR